MTYSRQSFLLKSVASGLLLLLLLTAFPGFSQSFRVCTSTDSQKNERGCGNRFELKADTLTLMLIVDMENKKVGADSVEFTFYKFNQDTLREFISKVPIAVKKSSTYFYLPIDFYNEGRYFVEVRKLDGDFIAEGGFVILFVDTDPH
jgi:hypothetical protein